MEGTSWETSFAVLVRKKYLDRRHRLWGVSKSMVECTRIVLADISSTMREGNRLTLCGKVPYMPVSINNDTIRVRQSTHLI